MKTAWKWLSGKKQKIANAYWGLWIPLMALLPQSGIVIPHEVVVLSGAFGLFLTYLGLSHAAVKEYLGTGGGVK